MSKIGSEAAVGSVDECGRSGSVWRVRQGPGFGEGDECVQSARFGPSTGISGRPLLRAAESFTNGADSPRSVRLAVMHASARSPAARRGGVTTSKLGTGRKPS